MLHRFTSSAAPPRRFTYPFCYEPHPLAQHAAQEVQRYIASQPLLREDADHGKMFGVLVCESDEEVRGEGKYIFLAAYSGLLAGRNDWDYFVPPVYDARQPDGYFKQQERLISSLHQASSSADKSLTTYLSPLSAHSSPPTTNATHKSLSQELQQWLFRQYRMLNARGEERDVIDLWREYYNRPKLLQKYPVPPSGTGDCCAPKLLQQAYRMGLKPLCMAEFWWGRLASSELRRHLNYYPACRGKCMPLLTWMLQGLDVEPDPVEKAMEQAELEIVYEDDSIAVVNKPSGMLSVPGRLQEYSVERIVQRRCPEAKAVHRLDMATSGLLVVAKTPEAYANLQQQFVRHEVRKRYVAVLDEKGLTAGEREMSGKSAVPSNGKILLPMRPDPMDRPRQVVDMEHGKRAETRYEFIDSNIVSLYPLTGRTHQLRVHCAHPQGLGRPIVGDELYGTRRNGQRLMLHAAELWLRHPVTDAPLHFLYEAGDMLK